MPSMPATEIGERKSSRTVNTRRGFGLLARRVFGMRYQLARMRIEAEPRAHFISLGVLPPVLSPIGDAHLRPRKLELR
jgi:hypothetical protein